MRTGRLVAAFVLLTMLPLAVLAYASVRLADDAVSRQADSRVRDTAAVSAALVEEQVKGLTDLVNSYTNRPLLIDALRDSANYNVAALDLQLVKLHTGSAGNATAFVSDPGGRLIDVVPPSPSIIGRTFSFRDWYRGVMATGRPYVSEAYESAVTGHPRVVAIAAPIRGTPGHGPVLGILVAGYEVHAIQGFVKTFADVQGISLTTTDQRGTLVSAPGKLPGGLLSQRKDPRVAAALQGRSGVAHLPGPDGGVLSGYAPVPGLGWTVHTDVPASTALASVSALRTTVIAIAVGSAVILVGLLALLALILRRRNRDESALEANRRQAAESDALFTLSLDMFAVAGFDGYFKRLNDAWTEILGYRLDELRARPFVEFVHPDDVQATVNETAALAAGGSTVAFENRYRHADGSYRTLAWSARGRPEESLIYAVARDVSIQKQTEETLRLAQERAMEAARLKSEFLANMSHEIRTPMNGVIGITDLLISSGLTPEQAEYAETIRRSGDALLRVINDILDFSKIEAGRLEIEVVDVDLRTTVEDVAEAVAAAAQRAELEVATFVDPALPDSALGDPGRIRQVLLNLAANAVKFTERGEVVIRALLDRDLPDELQLRFEVTDTGIGIGPETQTRLFSAFTQGDASTTRRYGGTGLGLAISSQLVSLMGGEIGVDSELGQGSTFWFTARLKKNANGLVRAPQRVERKEGVLDGVRVLVVDDNHTNRSILEKTLAAWGAHPRLASSGKQALRMLRAAAKQGGYDLVLLDSVMPGMNGLELAHHIRNDPALSAAKLVMLTSLSQETRVGREAALDASLSKPVRQSHLYDCLVTVMTNGSAVTHRQPASQSRGDTVQPASGFRVLVAEDNPVNQMVAVRMLEQMGHHVDVVMNGAAAVEALTRVHYAAVLMDCQMPVMDGFEATAAIRRREGDERHTPIIAMTAGAMEGDEERCLSAGMDDYLPKPVRAANLATKLEQWIPAQPGTARQASGEQADQPLERGVIKELRELGETTGRDLLGELAALYVTNTGDHVEKLRQAVGDGDAALIAQLAHGIKGSSGNVGAHSVADACASLELAVRDGDRLRTREACASIEVAFARARAALDAEVSGELGAMESHLGPPPAGAAPRPRGSLAGQS